MSNRRGEQGGLEPGTPLNGYRIERLLGVGNFGITYKAEDVLLNMPVAIKEYFPASVAERGKNGDVLCTVSHKQEEFDEGKMRFVIEAKIAAKFNHPNIVNILRYFYENNTAYLVMRYEPGDELSSLINKGQFPAVPVSILLPIFRSVLTGLKILHEAGCVHRDIKPSNIFIREGGEPMLLDFGGAQAEDVTGAREVKVVTPYYAPIEQYDREADSFSPSLDIYALGATLYRCIKGKPPARSTVRQSSVDTSGKDPYESIALLQPEGYSAVLLELIDGMLELRAVNRPQSAVELLQRLDEVITENSTAAPALGPVLQEVLTIVCSEEPTQAQFFESLANIAELIPGTSLTGAGVQNGVNQGFLAGTSLMASHFQMSYPKNISAPWQANIFVSAVADIERLLKGAVPGGSVIWLINSTEATLGKKLTDFQTKFAELANTGLSVLIGVANGQPDADVSTLRKSLAQNRPSSGAANTLALMALQTDRSDQVAIFINSLLALREAKTSRG